MKIKIDLTDDQIDNVVLYEMQRHSKILKSNISDLNRRKKKLKKFEKDDLVRFNEVLVAMDILLDYYGSHLN